MLACNNYQIHDLGVMVPANKILDEAERLGVDVIGLSGLITPSLDEMVNVAAEMERRGLKTPLLIGGATTSKTHTAIKIEPAYSRPYRARTGRQPGRSGSQRAADTPRKRCARSTGRAITEEYERVRVHRAGQQSNKKMLPIIAEARKNGLQLDWENYTPPVPTFLRHEGTGRLSLWRSWSISSTGRPSSAVGGWPGSTPIS